MADLTTLLSREVSWLKAILMPLTHLDNTLLDTVKVAQRFTVAGKVFSNAVTTLVIPTTTSMEDVELKYAIGGEGRLKCFLKTWDFHQAHFIASDALTITAITNLAIADGRHQPSRVETLAQHFCSRTMVKPCAQQIGQEKLGLM